jgi:hypothetical protein
MHKKCALSACRSYRRALADALSGRRFRCSAMGAASRDARKIAGHASLCERSCAQAGPSRRLDRGGSDERWRN